MNTKNKRTIAITYICFAINGMLALSIGSLLPSIRDSRGLGYNEVGTAVSAHAVGVLISGFFAGIVSQKVGRKISILFFSVFFPAAYILILTGNGLGSLVLACLFLGFSRGATSNYCNAVINELAPGKASIMNGLHAMFSLGAFLFPLLFAALIADSPENWRYACVFMIGMGILSILLYVFLPAAQWKTEHSKAEAPGTGKEQSWGFLRERLFYISIATLFFYLCAENGVTGWMVTYFTDTGYISASYAQLTASLLWIMILAGRLTTAFLSERIDKKRLLPVMGIGLVFFFTFLLLVKTPVLIVIGIMCFGFFMAGVFPTTVSVTGVLIDRYPLAWSFILTASSMGGVVMPAVVGAIAQKAGIVSGIASIAVALVIELVCILCIVKPDRK